MRITNKKRLLICIIAGAITITGSSFYTGYHIGKGQAKTIVKTVEKVEYIEVEPKQVKAEPELISLGIFEASAYCCENFPHICNDGDATETATRTTPTVGRTIAVAPDVIPYGTEVIINGHTYIAEDTGGAIKGKRVDILFATHSEALQFGRQKVEVFVKNEP